MKIKMKRIGRFIINYFKLFLMPFILVFMIFALIVKGIDVLLKKAAA